MKITWREKLPSFLTAIVLTIATAFLWRRAGECLERDVAPFLTRQCEFVSGFPFPALTYSNNVLSGFSIIGLIVNFIVWLAVAFAVIYLLDKKFIHWHHHY